jgi:uncharacterized protein (DUF736 family)
MLVASMQVVFFYFCNSPSIKLSIVTENETPRISGNNTVHVTVNRKVEIRFNSSDDGDDAPKYSVLKQPDNFDLDDETGVATWTPQNANVSEIR